jgi:hypothetical protein
MRNMLALLSAVVLLFAGVGWYRGWYHVQSSPARAGHHAVNIDIDKEKIGKDLHDGEEELQKVLERKPKEDSKRSEQAPPDASTPNPKQKSPPDPRMPSRN